MKTVMLSMFVMVLFGGQSLHAQLVEANQPANPNQVATIKWVTTVLEMGEIPQNIPAKATFEFTNISTEPVLLINARSSCGCTIPDYSKEPVLPKGTSSVTAIYNARGIGPFQKTVTVITNDNMEHKLTLKGTVVAASTSQPE